MMINPLTLILTPGYLPFYLTYLTNSNGYA